MTSLNARLSSASIQPSLELQKKVTRFLWSSIFLVLVLSSTGQDSLAEAARGKAMDERLACTRQASRWSCILGCFKCAETYGRKVYDMALCCGACQATKAILIDDGPEVCSMQFFVGAEGMNKGFNEIKRHQTADDWSPVKESTPIIY